VKGLENCLGVYSDESHNNRSSSESRNLAQERDPKDFSTSEQWCQDRNSVSQSDLSFFPQNVQRNRLCVTECSSLNRAALLFLHRHTHKLVRVVATAKSNAEVRIGKGGQNL
jgi:hypothetical protein